MSSNDKINILKDTFTKKLEFLTKSVNSGLISPTRYSEIVNEVELAKEKQKNKEKLAAKDYRRLSRYDILSIDETKKLIVPTNKTGGVIKFFVQSVELFDIIHEAHIQCGHGGRIRVEENLKRKFHNIPRDVIMTYLSLCKPCQKKRNMPRKGLVVKAAVFNDLNSRAQVDLIDFHSCRDGDYKFILAYQDHFTKYCILRPLKSKRPKEVSLILLDIFSFLGAPNILQSSDGREFSNQIIQELSTLWPGLKMVHGKSQSQGSVDRANQDVESMLKTWMEETQSSRWSEGLRFCQFRKNSAYCSGIKQTPYEALFGRKARLGLRSCELPSEVLEKLVSEEDLKKMLSKSENNDTICLSVGQESMKEEILRHQDSLLDSPESHTDFVQSKMCMAKDSINKNRKKAGSLLESQAKKIKTTGS